MDGAERIRELIVAVRRRWFAAVAFRAIGLGAASAAVPALAAGLAYWLFSPSGGSLLLLTGSAILMSLAGLTLVAWRIERRPDDRRVARFIEERAEAQADAPPMNDCIVSAVQAMAVPLGDERAPFAGLVVGAAVRCVDGLSAAAIVPGRDLRTSGVIAAGGLLSLAITLAVVAPALSHAVQTARLQLFPSTVSIEVLPGDVRLMAGQPLRIRAKLGVDGDSLSRVEPRLVVSSGAEQRIVDMVAAPDGYQFQFDSVDRTFTYHVTAGAAASSEHTVTALFPPRVKRIDLHYAFPSFSGLAPRVEEDGGDIYGPAGTRVRLRIETDKPIASGALALSGGEAKLSNAGERTLEAEVVLARDDAYRVRLVDRDGLRSEGDSEYFIRLMDDRPPDVRILRPSADQSITPLEEVAIEARAEDDYGIAALDLVYSVAGGKEHVVPFSRVSATETQRTGAYMLAAEELKVRPGDVIAYYARARDVARGKRPTVTQSDLFFLEVKPFNAEFETAQSQAGGGGGSGDPQLDALIAAQKEVISATWNIERRSAAGRSTADINAVAQAQAELKARVERALGGAGRRRGEFAPQRVQAPAEQGSRGTGEAVAAAIEAMSRAVEHLGAGKTRDAITHEMTALNRLLQAQAEVRRRQVMQQSASSGGGAGNRQSQDLSALFDKELQRQQRTNYEQRSQVQERPEQQQADEDFLDRIRDLARRQDELNRQQRELAGMSAEERKRQLDKLTRDQQELQRQAEELSRQMRQQSSPGTQQPSQGQPQAGGSAAMRDAVEQMRQAANEMRREDAQGATRSGERAAEQLRRTEQQVRGGSATARQRAAADLQAEGQQIVQEQRRIAAEADRLEKGREANTGDARRRLAADKDRLADRVDALQREAQRLGRDPGRGDEQAKARQAAGQLERDRVGQRMRESAQQMREGKAAPSGQAEQQLARNIEQAVEKLGAATGAQAQQMAEQLERSRATRERLDTLEAQVREARERKDGSFEKLRQQYEQELRRTRDTLGRQQGASEQRDGRGESTPEQQEFSRSAPGTEAFKQDRSGWESLRQAVDRALEEHDAAVSRRLAQTLAEDRLNAGGSERVPEQYRRLVAKYYESLAQKKRER